MSIERVATSLGAFVRQQFPGIPYLARWSGRVVGQNSLGAIEVIPDVDSIPGEVGVAPRAGLPGVTMVVPNGVRCEVGYANGDPRFPVSCGWEPGADNAADELEIEANDEIRIVAGQPADEHLLTVEQFVNLMIQFIAVVLPTMATPVTPAPAPPFPSEGNATIAALAAWVQTAAGSGTIPASVAASLQSAIAGQATKGDAVPGLGQTTPGIACKGFLSG